MPESLPKASSILTFQPPVSLKGQALKMQPARVSLPVLGNATVEA